MSFLKRKNPLLAHLERDLASAERMEKYYQQSAKEESEKIICIKKIIDTLEK